MGVKAEAGALLGLSWPIFASGVAQAGMTTVAALFLGRDTDADVLGGAYVAMSVFNVFAFSPMSGLSSAVSTLVANAVGAGEYHKVGAYVQLGVVVNWIYATVLLVPLIGRPDLLLQLVLGHKQPGVIAVAASYLRIYALALIPYALLDALHRCLMARSMVWPMVASSVSAVLSNVMLHTLFVTVGGFGAVGSATAMTLAATLQVTCLVSLVAYLRLAPKVWGQWTPHEVAAAVRPYLRLSLPGAAVLCAEWWALEMTTVLMARYSPAQLTAHVVTMNLAFLTYMAPVSVGMAVMTRVGNALGASSPSGARRTCWVAFALAALAGSGLAAALYAARTWWPQLYSANRSIQVLLTGLTPALAAYVFADACLAIFGRVLRGSGRQRLGAAIYIAGYWGGVLPLCAKLAAAGETDGTPGGALGGMWKGLVAGKASLVGVMVAVAVATDWEDQSRRALQRLGVASQALQIDIRADGYGSVERA